MNPPQIVLALYFSGALALTTGLQLEVPREPRSKSPLERGHSRGEVAGGIPRLDGGDPAANAALLREALAAVPHDGGCDAVPRHFALLVDQRLSRVRFPARVVCQLQLLKRISVAQPGFGRRGLAEVAGFVLGRRLPGSADVDVSRIVVPPFRFTGETITFLPADLGPLLPDEVFLGTYHTHPEGDLTQGVLSEVDLRFMEEGYVDFHGQVGWLANPRGGVEWLFDIVEPRSGDWNVYAHDRARLAALARQCAAGACPVDQLRITGSPFYLFTRFYEERDDEGEEIFE